MNNYAPVTTYISYTEVIQSTILERLYTVAKNYWLKRLDIFALENAERAFIEMSDDMDVKNLAVHYKGKNWAGYQNTVKYPGVYRIDIPAVLDEPEWQEEIDLITSELVELNDEKYEVQRFLQGFTFFEAPLNILKKTLGDRIYDICKVPLIDTMYPVFPEDSWNKNDQEEYYEYVNQHQYIIDLIHNRVLSNLISDIAYKDI